MSEKLKLDLLSDPKTIRFDGGANPGTRADYRSPEASPDPYIRACGGGAVNLHIFRLGLYRGCVGCRLRDDCCRASAIAGD